MNSHKNEAYFCNINGQTAVFVTARADDRTDEALSKEVPDYFEPKFGTRVEFQRKIIVADNLSKNDADYGKSRLINYYRRMGYKILNVRIAKELQVMDI